MNILVADSGSTKTEWIFTNNDEKLEHFFTDGLNPYFYTSEEATEVISSGLKSLIERVKIDKVCFYGAGCSHPDMQKVIKDAISVSFREADIIVNSDLLAAARASLGRKPGVACILGTGSNSCIYDGNDIVETIPSLGFTLGDEGSGGYFGKQLLNSFFYKSMPEDLRATLKKEYNMSLEHILHKVYKEPQANRFVASFSSVLGENEHHPYIIDMVRKGFEDFVTKQLSFFGDLSGQEIGFVGSIAYIYRNILKEVLEDHGMVLGHIVQKPIVHLLKYHLELLV